MQTATPNSNMIPLSLETPIRPLPSLVSGCPPLLPALSQEPTSLQSPLLGSYFSQRSLSVADLAQVASSLYMPYVSTNSYGDTSRQQPSLLGFPGETLPKEAYGPLPSFEKNYANELEGDRDFQDPDKAGWASWCSSFKIEKKVKKRMPRKKREACISCGTLKTPGWRKGPDGKISLCNACGIRFSAMNKRNLNGPSVLQIKNLLN
eukprot:TRINITY_DN5407_c0_g3_i1.p1 TRINITY_DN5407_c0_g3~~TRINITY_DN5407_c0_g3_i1.p1  ORF type:complete len:206 (-),score=35.66 TRINITY_DN5407_c0_g3_i1:204-821(-)